MGSAWSMQIAFMNSTEKGTGRDGQGCVCYSYHQMGSEVLLLLKKQSPELVNG